MDRKLRHGHLPLPDGYVLLKLFQEEFITSLSLGLLGLPLSFFLADLITGIIHWAFDSFGSSDTPIWGPLFVAPFRRHHEFPYEITQTSLAENLGSSCFAGILALVIWPVTPVGPNQQLWGFFVEHFWLSLVVFSVLANLFHRWAHLPASKRPKWLVYLQKFRIVLRSKDHLMHHTKPHRTYYCILCGWANPLTNRIPWNRIETMMARIGVPTAFE